jgi:hypothetical protein
MFAPIEVKANRQLYCRIFFINLLHLASPLNLASEVNGSGRGRNGGMTILPPLQQLLYIGWPDCRLEPCLTPSRSQKIAWQ